jgi:hypothetical protein
MSEFFTQYISLLTKAMVLMKPTYWNTRTWRVCEEENKHNHGNTKEAEAWGFGWWTDPVYSQSVFLDTGMVGCLFYLVTDVTLLMTMSPSNSHLSVSYVLVFSCIPLFPSSWHWTNATSEMLRQSVSAIHCSVFNLQCLLGHAWNSCYFQRAVFFWWDFCHH